LNFGNPYNPEVYYQFAHAIKGMGDACRKFNTPVTGGNVSFYNQATLKDKVIPVYPTPTIGMLGIVDDHQRVMTLDFKSEGDVIYLLGQSRADIGSSEYLRRVHGVEFSNCPTFNLEEEVQLHGLIRQLIEQSMVQSVHDVSEGGLLVALLESAQAGKRGFEVRRSDTVRKDAWLFGEAQSRVVVSVRPELVAPFEALLESSATSFERIGQVEGTTVLVDGENWGSISDWNQVYDTVLENIMN
jgi:phosphoribosylformylglycinamidine (FGAM) synthase-like enzyme